MVYEYHCASCDLRFDVIKRAADYDCEERCTRCDAVATRQFVPQRIHLFGTAVESPEYNPGLGCIVNNKQHRKEIAKSKGLIELGSESADNIHKHYDKAREEKHEAAWEEASKGWIGSEG
jgi:putative FmdB family regulatory protein